MGNVLSHLKALKFAIKLVLSISKSYNHVLERIKLSPGLPMQHSTRSFWMDPPAVISSHRPVSLPEHADVVIIGSGITGTAFARTLFAQLEAVGGSMTPKVVMLEARDACSGATGRNGGHIKPPLHHDYSSLKRKYGIEQAKAIIRFRLEHIAELQRVAADEDIVSNSQCRGVESLDVFFESTMFDEAKEQLREWKADMPVESRDYFAMEKIEAIDKFRLSADVVGVIYNQAGAIHPYRFVTSILGRLADEYDKNFYLSTHTPCESILPPSLYSPYYSVVTPRGTITTPHVVHATNAWVSHLLEPMRTKIFPVRGNMSAQRPGTLLSPSTLDGRRSWVFYDKHVGYDYLTQLPDGENELMFGGGFFQGKEDFGLAELGVTDDGEYHAGVTTHLAGALPAVFGERNWGAEKAPTATGGDEWLQGRVKALWSGIIGVSADGLPWVGRVPPKLAGRDRPPLRCTPTYGGNSGLPGKECLRHETAAPGEWLAAGYSGEGMAHAYMSGKALAYMLLGMDDDEILSEWFPDVMRVTERRWRKARVEDLLDHTS